MSWYSCYLSKISYIVKLMQSIKFVEIKAVRLLNTDASYHNILNISILMKIFL